MSESGWVAGGGRLPVEPSDSHTVLSGPAGAASGDRWDEHHVRLPCSPQNLYPQRQPDGQSRLVQRWAMIQEALLRDIKTSDELEDAIKSYNSRYKDRWDFAGLRYFIDEVLADEERQHLFSVTLPQLCRLALRLPELLPSPLPLLVRQRAHSVTLTQLQVAALLANAFFCTFPRRNAAAKRGDKTAEYSTYPDINFNRLFAWGGGRRRAGAELSPRRVEKLKCLLHYFHRVLRREPSGLITFSRRYLRSEELPDWAAATAPLPPLRCHSDRLIEDQQGALQVDFANKFVGGGVLGDGCVQEEIRFLINPELIVTRLFTEVLGPTECLVITGCERFSQFEGYADTFRWTAKATDPTPTDQYGRRETQIVALDAVHFFKTSKQYEKSFLLRELNKAYVGFSTDDDGPLPPVATGNWGCGAFNGDPRFKALLQLLAAAMARREVIYLTFGDEAFRDALLEAHAFVQQRGVTVGQLYRLLVKYGGLYAGPVSRPDLFRFLRGQLGSGDGSDYGSDTDAESQLESEPAPEPKPDPEAEPEQSSESQSELVGLDKEDWSQEVTEEQCEVTRTSMSPEDDVTPNMDMSESESGPAVSGSPDVPAERPAADTPGVKRVRRAGSGSDTEAGAAPGSGAAPPAKAAAGARTEPASSTAQQFAQFEVISETTRSRAAGRQAKITSYLGK